MTKMPINDQENIIYIHIYTGHRNLNYLLLLSKLITIQYFMLNRELVDL